MTDEQYLQKLLKLVKKLTDTVESDGFRSDAYYAVLDEVNTSAARFNRSRQRRHWLPFGVIFFLVCFLFWLIVQILCKS